MLASACKYLPLKVTLLILAAVAGYSGRAAGLDSGFFTARTYYADGEFGKAAASFQMSCKVNNEAEACYWAGMSYQRLADIATPFGGKNSARAREYLKKATQLAPGCPEYRDALFNFLLDTAHCSRTALRDAAGILATMAESDAGYIEMRRRFEQEIHLNSSANARLSRLFLIVPRVTYRIAELPASAVATWPATALLQDKNRSAVIIIATAAN
jgi:hypothetical protein